MFVSTQTFADSPLILSGFTGVKSFFLLSHPLCTNDFTSSKIALYYYTLVHESINRERISLKREMGKEKRGDGKFQRLSERCSNILDKQLSKKKMEKYHPPCYDGKGLNEQGARFRLLFRCLVLLAKRLLAGENNERFSLPLAPRHSLVPRHL